MPLIFVKGKTSVSRKLSWAHGPRSGPSYWTDNVLRRLVSLTNVGLSEEASFKPRHSNDQRLRSHLTPPSVTNQSVTPTHNLPRHKYPTSQRPEFDLQLTVPTRPKPKKPSKDSNHVNNFKTAPFLDAFFCCVLSPLDVVISRYPVRFFSV